MLAPCYQVTEDVVMWVTRVPNYGSPSAVLLRESFREGGKVKNRTPANLSRWPDDKVAALQAVLVGKTATRRARWRARDLPQPPARPRGGGARDAASPGARRADLAGGIQGERRGRHDALRAGDSFGLEARHRTWPQERDGELLLGRSAQPLQL